MCFTLFTQGKSCADAGTSAATICRRVGNPKGATARVLSTLFQTGPKTGKKRYFDPEAECAVASQKSKKKATNQRIKPKILTVVLLAKKPEFVPKGHLRKKLTKSGRIQKIEFKRSMTSSEVKSVIGEGFSGFETESAQFLRCGKDNIMLVSEEQALSGDSVINLAGQGSLYLTQKRVDVSNHNVKAGYIFYSYLSEFFKFECSFSHCN